MNQTPPDFPQHDDSSDDEPSGDTSPNDNSSGSRDGSSGDAPSSDGSSSNEPSHHEVGTGAPSGTQSASPTTSPNATLEPAQQAAHTDESPPPPADGDPGASDGDRVAGDPINADPIDADPIDGTREQDGRNRSPNQGGPPPQWSTTGPDPMVGQRPRVVRSPDGPIGGVATGIANALGVDPILVQLAFVIGILLSGLGILVYVLLWLLLPQQTPSGYVIPASTSAIVAAVVIVLLFVIGTLTFFTVPVGGMEFFLLALPAVALISLGVVLLSGPRRTVPPGTTAPMANPMPTGPVQPGSGTQPGMPARYGPPAQPLMPVQYAPSARTTNPAPSQVAPAPGPVQYGAAPTGNPGWVPPSTASPGWYGQYQPVQQPWATARTPTDVAHKPRPYRAPIVAITLAVAAIAVGVLIIVGSTTNLTIEAVAVWGALALVCGVGLVTSGLRGWTAWWLIPVGLISVLAVPIAIIDPAPAVSSEVVIVDSETADPESADSEDVGPEVVGPRERTIIIESGRDQDSASDENVGGFDLAIPGLGSIEGRFGEASYVVADEDALADEYQLDAGELSLNLTDLTLSEDRQVIVRNGFGDIDIKLPRNVGSMVTAEVAFGEISVAGELVSTSGVNESLVVEVEGEGGEQPTLSLIVELEAGNLEVSP